MKLHQIVDVSEAVGATRSRKAKVAALAALLQRLDSDSRPVVLSWLSGELRQGRIGIGPAALQKVWETPPAPRPRLRVLEVDAVFTAIAAVAGRGSVDRRLGLLREILADATPPEQHFLLHLLMGELRQGALQGVLVEAVAVAAGVEAAAVRRALMLSGDIRATGKAAFVEGAEGLASFRMELFRPLSPMLADTADSVDAVFERHAEAVFELKLDGARVQVHKDHDRVRVFSRSLRDVTRAVPEVVEQVLRLPADRLVLDGETIALGPDGRPLPFQTTMRRFGRKLDVAAMRAELPLSLFLFDCMLLDDDELIDSPQQARMDRLVLQGAEELVVPQLQTALRSEARAFLEQAIADGHEGVMAKDPMSMYAAGHRGSGWLKLKPVYTLDLVVLAAEWGSGRRKGWLSNLHLGARDPSGGWVMLGKTFKGLSDQVLKWQTSALLARETGREGHVVEVAPELVVEIAFNEVQESPRYPGGLALRFARVKGYRPDKSPDQADTIDTVRAIHRRGILPGLQGRSADEARTGPLSECSRTPVAVQGDVPRRPMSPLIALVGATLMPVEGPPIQEGTLLIRGSRIVALGPEAELEVPPDATVVDVRGKVIVPGLIDLHSHIGGGRLHEHLGQTQPGVSAVDAINPSHPSIQRAQAGGITTVNIMPGSGKLLGGQTAYLDLVDTAVIDEMLRCSGPAVEGRPDRWGRICGGVKMANGTNPQGDKGDPASRMGSAFLQREALWAGVARVEAEAEAEAGAAPREARPRRRKAAPEPGAPPERDVEAEVLAQVLRGERLVHFHSHREDDIVTALRLREELGFELVLHHGSEGFKVADEIAAAGVPVAVNVLETPGGKEETLERRLDNPALLHERGVKVALITDDPVQDSRLLLRTGGLAVRGGLPEAEALVALTLAPAEILGMAESIGSLAHDKEADFVVLSGSPFSTWTLVEQTWNDGVVVFNRADPEQVVFATGGDAVPAELRPKGGRP